MDFSADALLAGHYISTSPVVTDVENSLFTNVGETMPSVVTSLRFECGAGAAPPPPTPIDLVSGHLHYYRYNVGGKWTTWEPEQVIASWTRVPRRMPSDGSARPAWFAMRQANAEGLIDVSAESGQLRHDKFGIRITVHIPKNLSHKAIANCEFLIDGAIAAFHHDQLSDELVAALLPRLPGVAEHELRRALSCCAGPLFPTPAVQVSSGGAVQISPADDRCWLGEYTVRRDSTSRWPEISGQLFTLRPITSFQETSSTP